MASILSRMRIAMNSNPSTLENNPILRFFDVGEESSCAGHCLVWRVFDACRKSDKKECSVFVFDKRIGNKVYKPKKKETMLDRIRSCILSMDKIRHPRMLQIIHTLEEGTHTLAFASEPVYGSLENIFAWHDSEPVPPGMSPPVMPHPTSVNPNSPPQPYAPSQRSPFAREYHFLDIELRFGMLQIIEALNFIHYTARQVHRNICPQVVIVTKRGTWKLFGLEFAEPIPGPDPIDRVPAAPHTVKLAKICQPCLDYSAPEVQMNGHCTILSDMFSFGLIICTLFNNGRPLLQANNNPVIYMRQIERLHLQIQQVLPRIPLGLQEAVMRLLSRDPLPRPTAQLLPLINYFKCQSEPAIQALQFLDVITLKDLAEKRHFYRSILIEALPFIPKKLRWQNVWPVMQLDVRPTEILEAVLIPVIWMTNESTPEEFCLYMLPTLSVVMNSPKTVQAGVIFLENLHIVMRKSPRDDVNNELLPLVFASMDHYSNQIQTSSLIAIQNTSDYITDRALHDIVLDKVKILLEKNQGDVKVISLILGFFEKVLFRLERNHILDDVIPTILSMRMSEPDIVIRVVKLYKTMLMERKFAISTDLMATKMIPSLAPQTVNPTMSLEQFTILLEIVYDMLDSIEKSQRLKLKPDNPALPCPERRASRNLKNTDNVIPPPFNIPNLRVEQRKTSSAEEMARKNSVATPPVTTTANTGSTGGFKSTGIGQWLFGSNNSTNNDSNFLRVTSVFPNRRLSDNTLMTPKIRIAPSCASSPGGTPGGTAGLPARRHSSIGPQERRGSAVNLSPPTVHHYRGRGGSGSSLSVPSTSHCVGGSMPNTSSSVPFLLTSSMHSVKSRRPSASHGGSQGSSILQQISSGMHQLFSGRT